MFNIKSFFLEKQRIQGTQITNSCKQPTKNNVLKRHKILAPIKEKHNSKQNHSYLRKLSQNFTLLSTKQNENKQSQYQTYETYSMIKKYLLSNHLDLRDKKELKRKISLTLKHGQNIYYRQICVKDLLDAYLISVVQKISAITLAKYCSLAYCMLQQSPKLIFQCKNYQTMNKCIVDKYLEIVQQRNNIFKNNQHSYEFYQQLYQQYNIDQQKNLQQKQVAINQEKALDIKANPKIQNRQLENSNQNKSQILTEKNINDTQIVKQKLIKKSQPRRSRFDEELCSKIKISNDLKLELIKLSQETALILRNKEKAQI